MTLSDRDRRAVEQAQDAAAQYGGIVCRTSAALAWGWEVLRTPTKPHITVRKTRRTARLRSSTIHLRRANLPDSAIDSGVTTQARTLTDCLRFLPLIEGLCVADSALRNGYSRERFAELASRARGPGAIKIKLAALVADGRAANPFESALRGIALGIRGLHVKPQVTIREDGRFLGRPDLVDEDLRIILEADSAEFHATVDGINRDSRRYDTFAVHGWLVLRFTWQQVVRQPDWIRETLVAAVALRRQELGLPALLQTPHPHGDTSEPWAA